VKTLADSEINCRRRSVSRDALRPKFGIFFMTKALRSKSKASIDYSCGFLKCAISWNIVSKNQLIRLRTQGEEAFGVTLHQVKLRIIDTVEVRWGRVSHLKHSSERANSSTGLLTNYSYFARRCRYLPVAVSVIWIGGRSITGRFDGTRRRSQLQQSFTTTCYIQNKQSTASLALALSLSLSLGSQYSLGNTIVL